VRLSKIKSAFLAAALVGSTLLALPASATPQSVDAITNFAPSSLNAPVDIANVNGAAWVLNSSGGPNQLGSITIINETTHASTELNDPSFNTPNAIYFDGTSVWVANELGGPDGNGSISKIDPVTQQVTEIDDPSFNTPVALWSNGTRLFVVNTGTWTTGLNTVGFVSVIDIATSTVINTLQDPSFDNPSAISGNASAGVWVVDGNSTSIGAGALTHIDPTTLAITPLYNSQFAVPSALSIDPSSIWVTNTYGLPGGAGAVLQIDLATLSVTKIDDPNLDVSFPSATYSDGKTLWFLNTQGGSNQGYLMALDETTQAYTVIDDPSFLYPVALMPVSGGLWMVNNGDAVANFGSISVATFGKPVQPPSAPSAPVVTPTDGGLYVTWQPSLKPGTSPLSHYTATAYDQNSAPAGSCDSADGATLDCQISGLDPTQSYTVSVVATSKDGSSPASDLSSATTPLPLLSAPSTPLATYNGDHSITVTWTPSNGPVSLYSVRDTSSHLACFASGADSSCTIPGPIAPGTYRFVVYAQDGFAVSSPSDTSNPVAVPVFYNLNFALSGGHGTLSAISGIPAGTAVYLPSGQSLSFPGHLFSGWLLGKHLLAPGARFTPTSSTTLVASWRVAYAPSNPRYVYLNWRGFTLLVAWTVPSAGSSPITGYMVSDHHGHECFNTHPNCQISGLNPAVEHLIYVTAISRVGSSAPTAAFTRIEKPTAKKTKH